jgi:hypothetical protein
MACERAPLVLGVLELRFGVLLRLWLQQEALGRRLPDELLDPLGNVRVDLAAIATPRILFNMKFHQEWL